MSTTDRMKENAVEVPPAAMSPPPQKKSKLICNACREPHDAGAMYQPPCSQVYCFHSYCAACLNSMFLNALHDESRFPPRCCGTSLMGPKALKMLPTTTVRLFKAKRMEMSTRDETYCHRPTCSAFIAKHSIHNNEAFCQKCRATTCGKCKNAWHFGPCTFETERELLETAKQESWQRCPGCRRLVERDEGCNDML
jgi:hypothetical protein